MYKDTVRCSGCAARVTVVAERTAGDKSPTDFGVKCPACNARIGVRTSFNLDDRTIQIVGFERL